METGHLEVFCEGRYYASVEECLRKKGILDHTTSEKRTYWEQMLRSGTVVRLKDYGLTIVPTRLMVIE